MAEPFLSLIIPAHNEEERLPGTLEQVLAFLATQPYSYEVLVVENASLDRTYQVAQEFARQHPPLQVVQCPKRGKGEAVRQGMLTARGEYRFMCDADLSMPISEITRFLPPVLNSKPSDPLSPLSPVQEQILSKVTVYTPYAVSQQASPVETIYQRDNPFSF